MLKPKEPLIKSAMSRVAIRKEMIARRTTPVVVAHGLVTGAASRLREVRHSHLSRTCATRYRVEAATLRSQGVQQRKRPFAMQPFGTVALRAVCGVRLLVKGMGIWARARYWRNQPIAGSAQLSCNRGRYQRRGMLPHHRSLLRPVAAHFEAFLASHPAKPLSRPCGT